MANKTKYITLHSFSCPSFGWLDVALNGNTVAHVATFGPGEYTSKFGETEGAKGPLTEITNIVTVLVTRVGVFVAERDMVFPGQMSDKLRVLDTEWFAESQKLELIKQACRGRLDLEAITGVTPQMMVDVQTEWQAACARTKAGKAVGYVAANPAKRMQLIAGLMRKAMENPGLPESPLLRPFPARGQKLHIKHQADVSALFAVEGTTEVTTVAEMPRAAAEEHTPRSAKAKAKFKTKKVQSVDNKFDKLNQLDNLQLPA